MGAGGVASKVQKALHVGGVPIGGVLLVLVAVLCRDLCLCSRHRRHLSRTAGGALHQMQYDTNATCRHQFDGSAQRVFPSG